MEDQIRNPKSDINPANVAQSVEHIHGKDGVASSILAIGSERSSIVV